MFERTLERDPDVLKYVPDWLIVPKMLKEFGNSTLFYGYKTQDPKFPIALHLSSLPKKCPYSGKCVENEGKMRSRITPNTNTFYAVLDTGIVFNREIVER